MLKKWGDIQVGDRFTDGSTVTALHPVYEADCYQVESVDQSMVLSGDHLLLCDVSKCKSETKAIIKAAFSGYVIPTVSDRHAVYQDLTLLLESPVIDQASLTGLIQSLGLYRKGQYVMSGVKAMMGDEPSGESAQDGPDYLRPQEVKDVMVEGDPSQVSETEFWLPVCFIHQLIHEGECLKSGKRRVVKTEYVGKKAVRCVETDSHRFETCGFVHHNSVTLRNVILHCLTHQETIAIAMIDLKVVEFEAYKGVKGVVAVANSVREACEILRIQRECMYARNREMAKVGLNDIKDWKPQHKTGETMIFNWRFKDTDKVEIRLPGGEVKKVSVAEVEQYLT